MNTLRQKRSVETLEIQLWEAQCVMTRLLPDDIRRALPNGYDTQSWSELAAAKEAFVDHVAQTYGPTGVCPICRETLYACALRPSSDEQQARLIDVMATHLYRPRGGSGCRSLDSVLLRFEQAASSSITSYEAKCQEAARAALHKLPLLRVRHDQPPVLDHLAAHDLDAATLRGAKAMFRNWWSGHQGSRDSAARADAEARLSALGFTCVRNGSTASWTLLTPTHHVLADPSTASSIIFSAAAIVPQSCLPRALLTRKMKPANVVHIRARDAVSVSVPDRWRKNPAKRLSDWLASIALAPDPARITRAASLETVEIDGLDPTALARQVALESAPAPRRAKGERSRDAKQGANQRAGAPLDKNPPTEPVMQPQTQPETQPAMATVRGHRSIDPATGKRILTPGKLTDPRYLAQRQK